MNKQDRISTAILGIALYLIATGISFGAFSYFGRTSTGAATPNSTTLVEEGLDIDPSAPKTEACPINGAMHTKEERTIWEKRRPLAVMIENDINARPQSGLSYADVVYEAVVEGGITRFMGVFYCGISAKNVVFAPVRSARTPYLAYVQEYDPLYVHVGGAGNCNDDSVDPRAKALCQVQQYKIKDMDQFALPIKYPDETGKKIQVCIRNPERLGRPVETEHTMECYTKGLYRFAAEERGWTNVDSKGISWDKNFVPWKFKDDAAQAERGASGSASFVAYKGNEGSFGVRWEYDPSLNAYKRVMGGVPHTDLNNKQQITAHAVVLQFAKEIGPVDDHLHMLYENVGTGEATILMDGKKIEGTWKKLKRTDRTLFLDAKGKELQFNRGQIWVELLAKGTPVTIK